ncbi:MAG TPA: hemerythrin domain-containing protein [Candidatus Limnocylindrales bacterium]
MNTLITPWADEATLDVAIVLGPGPDEPSESATDAAEATDAADAADAAAARPRLTEPLRLEHHELLPHIDALASTADIAGIATEDELRDRVADAYRFLTHHLVPHARAEDAVLYGAVELAMRAPGATDTMRRDHVEVLRYVDALGSVVADAGAYDDAVRARVRAILYSLHAIVALHFAKEEELYLEILDRALDEKRAARLFSELEAAAAEAKSGLD